MAEWLFEAGIGEARAALVEDGHIVEAAIEPDDIGLRIGTVARARLVDLLPGRAGRLMVDGHDAWIAAVPAGVTQGASFTVEIVREALPEPGRAKPARAVAGDAAPVLGPDLHTRIVATGLPVRTLRAHEPDLLEAAGWSELLDEAETGEIIFGSGRCGGALRMTPTPAMTLFDVDGAAPLDDLSLAAARAVAQAIRRHGIGGSIGIDFPTLANKARRQAVAEAIDAHLAPPFERTTMNGFGFLQIIRPRPRASLPERLRADPHGHAARAALRRLEREPPGAPKRNRLPAAVLARITPDWRAELARRTGVTHELEPT